MHRMLVFDLDGTLCPAGKAMDFQQITKLRMLESTGHTIIICSGKPIYYLCGFVRQIGLRAPVLIGENGAMLQFGIDLPPSNGQYLPCSDRAMAQLNTIKTEIERRCAKNVWVQPGEIQLTPFFYNAETERAIEELLYNGNLETDEINIYHQADCFDLIPKTISKAQALILLSNMTGSKQQDFAAVGDGINDIPMFEFCDRAFILGDMEYPKGTRCQTLDAVLELLLNEG